jgi:hypothetical protein
MSNNIYNIKKDYLQLMQQIEELEGEITPEIEQQLIITEKDCEEKIKSFHGIIKHNEGDLQLIKDEKERLSKVANVKENLIKTLKSSVLEACSLFGYDGKSGNKKIDYDTLKVYTVNKDKIEVDEEKFNEFALQSLWKDEVLNSESLEYSIVVKLNHSQARQLINKASLDKDAFVVNINKTKIKECIESGLTVPHCNKINNPYIQFR